MKKGSLREVQQYSKKHLLMAKYFANQLALKRSGSEVERIGTTLYSSKIELTPHQIQAALFSSSCFINEAMGRGIRRKIWSVCHYYG